jgi:O-antigen/teichoic acid export membrane protein
LGAALLALASPVLARAFDFDPLPLALLAVGLPLQSGYGSSKAILISAARFDVQARLEFGFILIQVAAGIAGAFLAGSLGYAVGLVIAAAGKTVLAARASHSVWPEDIDGETVEVAGMTPNGDATLLETQTTMRTALLLLAQQADLLLIGSLLGRDSVALYRAAKSIAGIPGRAAAPVWSVIRPRLLRAWHAKDRATVRRLVLQPAAVFLSAAAVLSPALLFFAGSGLAYLYGAHFAAARAELLLLLAGTWCSTAVSGWFAYWTVIAGRLGLATGLAALQLGLTAAGALLAPTHGTPAVAAAASMAMVLSALLGWVALYRSTAAPRSA